MAKDHQSLYEQIGGEQGVESLVGAFYERVLADESIGHYFEHVPMDRLKMMQKEFFSEALGGPLHYTGHSLRQVHAGHKIKKVHVQRFVEILLETLEAEEEGLGLDRPQIDAIYSRIAIEADRVADEVGESG
ncbi:MAG: group 1 truncated hemoglobin [Verrucomicrobiota bacterium]